MIIHTYEDRISSFFDIQREITSDESIGIEFTDEEKGVYQRFANSLSYVYSKIDIESNYRTDIDKIINELEDVYLNSMLETYIQNLNSIAKCFVKGNYRYYTKREIEVSILKDFLNFIKAVSKDKRKVIINNIWQRLDNVERELTDDSLPF
jgi:serine/threonine-protein kinase